MLDRLFRRLFRASSLALHLSTLSVYVVGFALAWLLRDLSLFPDAGENLHLYFIFAAWILVLPISRFPVAHAMQTEDGAFDNQNPRAQQAALLEGWKARARAAHHNALESFAPFAAAVLVAHAFGDDPGRIATLCAIYLGLRAVYILLYLANTGVLRSTAWGLANGIVMVMMVYHPSP